MRFVYTLVVLAITIVNLDAQVRLEEYPLESNPILQRISAKKSLTQQKKLRRLFGEAKLSERNSSTNCVDDGVYESGETVYILSGDTLEICIDTTGFITFDNLSIDGNSGTATTDQNCITYISNTGVDLGLGDTMRVELCLDNGSCTIREFPVVVKRENEIFVESNVSLGIETDLTLCIDPANYLLPQGIATSSILECHDTGLATAANGNRADSCVLLTSNRLSGTDTLCLEISNDYCICDTYKFPFRVIGDTLDLPFLDDFSYEGPYPNQLWVDKDAFVNNRWAYQPPTVGFATMDGLDENGRPWGGGYGRADFLTSNYINLSPYNSSSNVYLTCFVQPKGYGFYPNEADSLVVEFKKSTGEWTQVHAFQGIEGSIGIIDSFPPFIDTISFNITSNDYLYNGFQFRFVNYAQNIGIRDVWHIDYVKLTANDIPNGSFEDAAFTNIPNDILKEYSSVPWRHFENSMLIDSIDIELYSQFEDTVSTNPGGLKLRELETGALVDDLNVLLLTSAIASENQRNILSRVHKFYRNPIDIPSLSGFNEDKLVFELEYNFVINSQNPGLFPEVERNDTVKSKTVFDNYFAYDDGSAELSMTIGETLGEAVAVEYTALVADTLRAVQIHFPHYVDLSNALFSLRIHTGELGNIVFEKFDIEPLFTDAVLDTLQGFTTYRLADDFDVPVAVAIPAGKFYVELEQASVIQLTRVGLDRNTPEAQAHQFFRFGGNWVGLNNPGAMMVRPVVGDFLPPNTAVEELAKKVKDFKIYPNPSNGLINLDMGEQYINDFEVSVFNALGQLLQRQVLDYTQLDLEAYENGIYYIKIKNLETNRFETHKITIFK